MGNFTGFSRNFEMSLNRGFENNFIFLRRIFISMVVELISDTNSRTGAFDKHFFMVS